VSVFRDKKTDDKKSAENLDEMAVDDCGEVVVRKLNESVGELGLLVLKSAVRFTCNLMPNKMI
jgi:hypothetical protein